MDVSDIFYFFFCSGEGKGDSGATGGGGFSFIFLKIPGGRGVSQEGVGGGQGGPGGCLQGIWGIWGGGGLNIFFRGRNARQAKLFIRCFLMVPSAWLLIPAFLW